MVSHPTGDRVPILNGIQPVHVLRQTVHSAAPAEVPDRLHRLLCAQKVAIERNNDVGRLKIRSQSDIRAKQSSHCQVMLLESERIVGVQANLRKSLIKLS